MFVQLKDIICKKIEDTEQKPSKPKYMYKFEGKCVGNKSWSSLDLDLIENDFNTIEV